MSIQVPTTQSSFSLVLVTILATLAPTYVHAQPCTLDPPLPTMMVDAAPTTTFLTNGQEGQILVQRKASDASPQVFETTSPDPKTWKRLAQAIVLSVRAAPENPDQAVSSIDSSVIRFIVPSARNSFWRMRTFVIRFCELQGGASAQQPGAASTQQRASTSAQPGGALAVVRVRVSPPTLAKLVAVGVLLLFYVFFALVASTIRSQPYPPAVKRPAVSDAVEESGGVSKDLPRPPALKWPAVFALRNTGWLAHLDPVVLTANAFNKGSIQKLQVLLFTFLVSGMVLSLVLRMGLLSELSINVAYLLGISAVGAAVAQKAKATRDRLAFEYWAWLVQKKVIPIHEEDPKGPRWSDLVMTNREFDAYKLQTLIFSVVVAVALLVAGEERLATFSVPNTLLGILGLSQVVYVAGTFASPPSIAELDEAIGKLRELESTLQTAVAQNTDTDDEGKLLVAPAIASDAPFLKLEERKKHAPTAMKRYSKQADQIKIMLESTLGAQVERRLLQPSWPEESAKA